MDKEEFIMEIMSGERAGRQALMRVNWTGSSRQVDGFMPSISSVRSRRKSGTTVSHKYVEFSLK